jgi:HTH-type transcriptional regulator/antitoxin HigA
MCEIKTEEQYEIALAEVMRLFDAEPDTPEEKRLVELIELVKAYEDVHYPMSAADK